MQNSPVLCKQWDRWHTSAGIASIYMYCKTLNIYGIKFLRFIENDILAYFNFGGHDILWLQTLKKI